MPGVVADTHTIVWYLSQDSRLSVAAHEALTTATTGGDLIDIPSIFRRSACAGAPSSVDQPRPKNPSVAGKDNLVAAPHF